jgi:hypothetical protein
MSDRADPLDQHHADLAEQIVQHMCRPPDVASNLVFDRQTLRILLCGQGPADTHIPADTARADLERYAIIPNRNQIETTEHIATFVRDEFRPVQFAEHSQALDALRGATTVSSWRNRLGDTHPAVQAYDAYILDFHHVVARMLMHGSGRHRIGQRV